MNIAWMESKLQALEDRVRKAEGAAAMAQSREADWRALIGEVVGYLVTTEQGELCSDRWSVLIRPQNPRKALQDYCINTTVFTGAIAGNQLESRCTRTTRPPVARHQGLCTITAKLRMALVANQWLARKRRLPPRPRQAVGAVGVRLNPALEIQRSHLLPGRSDLADSSLR